MGLQSNLNVCSGSKADVSARPRHVRFTPKSGHSSEQRFDDF
jgi:hypothetical protein